MSEPVTAGNPKAATQTAFQPPQVSITVGPVTDNPAYVGPDPDTGAVFLDLMYTNRYEGDVHKYMLGISSPTGFNGASVAFCQLTAPTLLWICDWTVAQFTVDPQIPDPFSVGSEWELLDIHIEPAMLGLAPDGYSVLRRISGTYIFGHKNPGAFTNYSNSPFAHAQYPRPQWLSADFSRTIPAESLTGNLVSVGSASRTAPEPPPVLFRGPSS